MGAAASRSDIVRRGYEHWRRREFHAAVEQFAPDFELHENPVFPEARVYHGADEFVDYATKFLDMFESYTLDVEEMHECGNHVLAFVRWTVRGHASGAPAELRIAHLWTFRGERVVSMRSFFEREEALAAAGLSATPFK